MLKLGASSSRAEIKCRKKSQKIPPILVMKKRKIKGNDKEQVRRLTQQLMGLNIDDASSGQEIQTSGPKGPNGNGNSVLLLI